MGCFRRRTSKSSTATPFFEEREIVVTSGELNPNVKEEVLLQIPGCKVHLMEEGEAVELASGEFKLIHLQDENVPLATVIRISHGIQWPLTKDEPVVKLNAQDYLFTLPVKDGVPLSYGVSFFEHKKGFVNHCLELLDSFLKKHSCFSGSEAALSKKNGNGIDWKEFAPRIEDYNSVLAKAIAGGTGHIVKGIFKCSDAYIYQVLKGGEIIIARAEQKTRNVEIAGGTYSNRSVATATRNIEIVEGTYSNRSVATATRNIEIAQGTYSNRSAATATRNIEIAQGMNSNRRAATATKRSRIKKNLRRVRSLSEMTEKLSKAMLEEVHEATGLVMAQVVKSKPGKAFFSMVPGEVLLASLDAVDKILDAAEAAEKQAVSATSKAAARMVGERFGKSAGEATEDVLLTAGHCTGAMKNICRMYKSFYPSSYITSGLLRNAAKHRNEAVTQTKKNPRFV